MHLQPCGSVYRSDRTILVTLNRTISLICGINIRLNQERVIITFLGHVTCLIRVYITERPSNILMVITRQVHNETFQTCLFVISDDRCRIQISRGHFLEAIRQYIQAVAHVDRLNKANASVSAIDATACAQHIRISGSLTIDHDLCRIGEVNQILTIVIASVSRSSMTTMSSIY